MGIECKDRIGLYVSDQFKTDAVHEAQLSPGGRQQGGNATGMDFRRDKMDMDQGKDVLMKHPHRFHADPALQQGHGFHNDIVARHKPEFVFNDFFPQPSCLRMVFIVAIENGVKGGRICEAVYLLKTSDK